MARRKLNPETIQKELFYDLSNNYARYGWHNYGDRKCQLNVEGKIYRAWVVGYRKDKPNNRFLVYCENLDSGSDGCEFKCDEDFGKPVRGRSTNHFWCFPAGDALELCTKPNSFYMLNEGYRGRLTRYNSIRVDSVTLEEFYKRYNITDSYLDQEKIADRMYELFCADLSAKIVKPAIRNLELDDE